MWGMALALLLMPVFASTAIASEKLYGLTFFTPHNAKLKPSAASVQRVVVLGDSIGNNLFRLGGGIKHEKLEVLNRSIIANTTQHMLLRFYPDVVALGASQVVLLPGSNDLAGQAGYGELSIVQNNISAMADIANMNGIRMLIVSPLPRNGMFYLPDTAQARQNILLLRSWLQEFCRQRGITYIDAFALTDSGNQTLRLDYDIDGVHINAAGCSQLIPLLQEELLKGAVPH